MEIPSTKTELMKLVEAGIVHECFQHSEAGWFDITRMRKYAVRGMEPVLIDINGLIDHLLASRDIEQARVDALTAEELEDPALVVVYQVDGKEQHLMIDGHHRAVRHHREGHATMLAYMVPEALIMRPPVDHMLKLDWGDPEFEKRFDNDPD